MECLAQLLCKYEWPVGLPVWPCSQYACGGVIILEQFVCWARRFTEKHRSICPIMRLTQCCNEVWSQKELNGVRVGQHSHYANGFEYICFGNTHAVQLEVLRAMCRMRVSLVGPQWPYSHCTQLSLLNNANVPLLPKVVTKLAQKHVTWCGRFIFVLRTCTLALSTRFGKVCMIGHADLPNEWTCTMATRSPR
jgi:hypothetical protein